MYVTSIDKKKAISNKDLRRDVDEVNQKPCKNNEFFKWIKWMRTP